MPKLTEEEKAIRQELMTKYINAIHGPDKVGQFANFTGFRRWAMAHGFQPGSELRRRDTEEDFTPENCYFAEPCKQPPFYGETKTDFIRRWNRAVNPLRVAVGLEPFADPAEEEKETLPE